MGKFFQIPWALGVKLSILTSGLLFSLLPPPTTEKDAFPKNLGPKKDAFLNMEYWRLVIWRDFVWSFGGDPQDAQRINIKSTN